MSEESKMDTTLTSGVDERNNGQIAQQHLTEEFRDSDADLMTVYRKLAELGRSNNLTKRCKLLAIVAMMYACKGKRIYRESVELHTGWGLPKAYCGAVLSCNDDMLRSSVGNDLPYDSDAKAQIQTEIIQNVNTPQQRDSLNDVGKGIELVCQIFGKYDKITIGKDIIEPFIKNFIDIDAMMNDDKKPEHVIDLLTICNKWYEYRNDVSYPTKYSDSISLLLINFVQTDIEL